MDLKYFKEQICEELCGAKMYIRNAIELKSMSSGWSKKMAQMSEQELNHASELYSMAMEYIDRISDSYEKIPEYITKHKDEIVDMYIEESTKIKIMHEMYKEQ